MDGKRFRAVSPKTIAIEFEDGPYEGARVICAADLSIGAYLDFTQAGDGADGTAQIRRFGREVLLDWNLDDKEGVPLPANEEGIMAVPIDLASEIIRRWNDGLAGVPAPLAEPSLSGEPLAEPTKMARSSVSRTA